MRGPFDVARQLDVLTGRGHVVSDIGRWLAAGGLAVAITSGAIAPAGLASAEPCPDVQVIFARGTFEASGLGAVGHAFTDSLRAKLPEKTVEVHPVAYPASLDFATAADGVVDASQEITNTVSRCPNTDIVLGGYSQGAAVAAYVTADAVPEGYILPPGITGPMPAAAAEHVAAVALFGKPSNEFLRMIHNSAPPLTVGSRYAGKTVDECLPEDPVCSPAGRDRGAHGAYPSSGLTDRAADYVVSKLM